MIAVDTSALIGTLIWDCMYIALRGYLPIWSGTIMCMSSTTVGRSLSEKRSAKTSAVWPIWRLVTELIAGTDPHSFIDQVFSIHVDDPQFSWQGINGEHDETILPAIMITTIQPAKFKETHPGYRFSDAAPGHADDKIILIPLRSLCKTGTEVVALIEKIFADIAAGKPLSDFAVAKHIKPNQSRGSYSDALILKPTLWGMGIDLKELFKMMSAGAKAWTRPG